ncbi:hypothetical protein JB92DRAFT_2827190 [Gautieria morchelliformis]|nr:hypothetical protein JB92DRAFT_2827190 [Gautieria morchelliformis]
MVPVVFVEWRCRGTSVGYSNVIRRAGGKGEVVGEETLKQDPIQRPISTTLERYQLMSVMRDMAMRRISFWQHVLYYVGRGRMKRPSYLNVERNDLVAAILCIRCISDGNVELVVQEATLRLQF